MHCLTSRLVLSSLRALISVHPDASAASTCVLTRIVLQQGDMDAEGVCSENKAEQHAVVVVPTPGEERLAEGDSAVVAVPLTADVRRLAEGSSAVVAEPLTERVSGDSDTEPFEQSEAGVIDDENANQT